MGPKRRRQVIEASAEQVGLPHIAIVAAPAAKRPKSSVSLMKIKAEQAKKEAGKRQAESRAAAVATENEKRAEFNPIEADARAGTPSGQATEFKLEMARLEAEVKAEEIAQAKEAQLNAEKAAKEQAEKEAQIKEEQEKLKIQEEAKQKREVERIKARALEINKIISAIQILRNTSKIMADYQKMAEDCGLQDKSALHLRHLSLYGSDFVVPKVKEQFQDKLLTSQKRNIEILNWEDSGNLLKVMSGSDLWPDELKLLELLEFTHVGQLAEFILDLRDDVLIHYDVKDILISSVYLFENSQKEFFTFFEDTLYKRRKALANISNAQHILNLDFEGLEALEEAIKAQQAKKTLTLSQKEKLISLKWLSGADYLTQPEDLIKYIQEIRNQELTAKAKDAEQEIAERSAREAEESQKVAASQSTSLLNRLGSWLGVKPRIEEPKSSVDPILHSSSSRLTAAQMLQRASVVSNGTLKEEDKPASRKRACPDN